MQTRISDLITAIGTDYKQFRTWITGSATGDLTTLTTTAKTSLLAAINEVNAAVGAATIPDATTSVKGKVELATDAETLAFTDTVRVVTPSNIGAVTNVANGLLKLNGSGVVGASQLAAIPDATTTVKGLAELATDAEALAMSDAVRSLTPANLAAITNVNNGLLKLDSGGKASAAQLPGYVDDTLEYANLAAFPGTGASGVMYIAADTNKVYRWTGSVYVEISASPGTTDAVTEGVTNLYFTNARADTRADGRITALVGNTDTDLAALYVTAKA